MIFFTTLTVKLTQILSVNALISALVLYLMLTTIAIADADTTQYLNNMMSVIKPPHSQIGLEAVDLTSSKSVFRYNADILMVPASTQKLLTAVAATTQLSEQFTFDTSLHSSASIRHGKLQGDLYLRFSGDPTLTSDDLRQLFKQLNDLGLYEISGNLYLVGQANEQLKAPGVVWDDLGICYAAPVSRFVINKNCILGQLSPMLANNGAKLSFPRYLPVKITTTAYFDKNNQQAFCELSLQRLPQNEFHIGGCFTGAHPVKLAIAITEPGLYAQQLVAQVIKSAKIRVKGKVKLTNAIDTKAKLIALHKSPSLASLIETMLLKSDNLIADQLFKAIGESVYEQPGTFANGAKAVSTVLTDAGVNLTHAQIVDGSGLSRYNLLSANQLLQVLQLIYRDPRFEHLIALLPVSGKSGTLRYKTAYNKAPLKDKVIAKTGSMQGVDNLAGFLSLDNELKIAFVVLENGQSPKTQQEQLAPFSALFLQTLLDSSDAIQQTASP
ncbi:D-alanyl-D-alanine carboxypeptidase/D-alanyl-D-alanine-endopeptidase [Shewanella mesophila]|uniref:D-alanyl-D-alanine carboxypeptidase/D-alanyl-D-alanine endopeptidase n=1 Tax=Shewanella mesophila TaxID=2864208 RepID=UPI001C659727|nr:D-alanyl-D-alanine carboxypeptidase/D-alanyl-D-alanine-endopeptidase [Shewanella mesophila]QYJ87834.1 D-alanyl-D-alanine carboxypeptidase/D-alanyl-D-alanine-endopeptidase [Shewanella mesophila]